MHGIYHGKWAREGEKEEERERENISWFTVEFYKRN